VRLYDPETGSARTGLFRRTLELSFLPAPPFRAISDRRSTTRLRYISDITASVDYFPTSLAHSSNCFSRLDFDTDRHFPSSSSGKEDSRDGRLPTIYCLSELPIADSQSSCRLYGRLYGK
jgi:hypothetical protein